uniref:Uncharacterized protein n=1 Tax=Arundo donax TaxID=35708 RepID=A0A0A9CXK6_ARUDO
MCGRFQALHLIATKFGLCSCVICITMPLMSFHCFPIISSSYRVQSSLLKNLNLSPADNKALFGTASDLRSMLSLKP